MAVARFRAYSTFSRQMFKVPSFRKGEHVKRNDRAVFCKAAECSICSQEKLGSATYHADCFNLFSKKCHAEDKYMRLWLAAKRASPMWNSGSLKLLYDPAASQQLNIVLELLGFARLPLDLTRLIWACDPTSSHIVARFCTVLQLADEMNSAPPVPSLCPLSEVRFWSRGQYHTARKDMGDELPYVRITADSRGLKRIERVESPLEGKYMTETNLDLSEEIFSRLRGDFRVSKGKRNLANVGHALLTLTSLYV